MHVLFMNNDEYAKEPPFAAEQLLVTPNAPAAPLFTVLMATGNGGTEPGTIAILVVGNGVVTPVRKKANTSLKSEQAYSLYSSEAKT
jgi:hypothetical protein